MSNDPDYATAITNAVAATVALINTGDSSTLKLWMRKAIELRGGVTADGAFNQTIWRAVIDEVLDEFGRAIAAKLATRLPPEWGEAADREVADTVANIKAEIAAIFQGE